MNVTQEITGALTTRPRTTPPASATTASLITDHVYPNGHERRRRLRRMPGENDTRRVDRREVEVTSCG
jgi:hypothetical protein